jgi:hypothetical protein
VAGVVLAAGVAIFVNNGASGAGEGRHLVIEVDRAGVNAPGAAGWQGNQTVTIPANTGSVEITYPCPGAAPVAVSGSYWVSLSARPGIQVVGDRVAWGAGYNSWKTSFTWGGSGTSVQTTIQLDVYCAAGPM